tara:strand:+ start:1207 stop:2271 length:1065 start_codon:yes stop_codon:yes gene_type:complete
MWFHKQDLQFHPSIVDASIRGYVLPHASTTYTGKIISHTLRFKPKFRFKQVCILYYPVSDKHNILGKYYHEYYVPMKCLKYFIDNKWNMKKISFFGINLRDSLPPKMDLSDTLIIVSADFSHFLPMQKAITLENKAAHSLMFKQHQQSNYINIVDHILSFKTLHKLIPKDWYLQWIGRTRSLGDKGVGYLSFLIKQPPVFKAPDGMFVTCYDNKMNARECLGEWFTHKKWTQSIEDKLIHKVVSHGQSHSRLTGGTNKHLPIKFYTVTYLYKDHKKMIRGYHGIKYKAFYLPEVLLEHTYPNGKWIQPEDTEWQDGRFMIKETIEQLSDKAGSTGNKLDKHYELYRSEVRHVKI